MKSQNKIKRYLEEILKDPNRNFFALYTGLSEGYILTLEPEEGLLEMEIEIPNNFYKNNIKARLSIYLNHLFILKDIQNTKLSR